MLHHQLNPTALYFFISSSLLASAVLLAVEQSFSVSCLSLLIVDDDHVVSLKSSI
eukprot:m.194741 g.194741  ORF g.194741 m.194741 type:complete len:55 (-) comp53709_c0_seq4:165-329(-)